MTVTDIESVHLMLATVNKYNRGMGRWEPNTRARLEQAAGELYIERGFEQTTVAEIAERAGTTERTFFRHFADKREVLFGGAGALQELIVNAVMNAPDSASSVKAVAAGLEAAGAAFGDNTERVRQRQAIIAANPELQARELSKLAGLASAIADALRQRGVADPAAILTAEAGIVVFRVAFERWINATRQRGWSRLVHETLGELRTLMEGERRAHSKSVSVDARASKSAGSNKR